MKGDERTDVCRVCQQYTRQIQQEEPNEWLCLRCKEVNVN